ncbi:hypothetical protein BD310DRAFT_912587 [Dichomitus squalens]|uniref:Uncharacterized protein n=1 Tax=Dichomitus squalens TaxID=114155 RepID=A0A4Q9QFL9_9APHY|nr:hypothetical protein BD310DRAFT_912587 [Dichomitus squalens]
MLDVASVLRWRCRSEEQSTEDGIGGDPCWDVGSIMGWLRSPDELPERCSMTESRSRTRSALHELRKVVRSGVTEASSGSDRPEPCVFRMSCPCAAARKCHPSPYEADREPGVGRDPMLGRLLDRRSPLGSERARTLPRSPIKGMTRSGRRRTTRARDGDRGGRNEAATSFGTEQDNSGYQPLGMACFRWCGAQRGDGPSKEVRCFVHRGRGAKVGIRGIGRRMPEATWR